MTPLARGLDWALSSMRGCGRVVPPLFVVAMVVVVLLRLVVMIFKDLLLGVVGNGVSQLQLRVIAALKLHFYYLVGRQPFLKSPLYSDLLGNILRH
jgi:uncharacterized membrane-anchored protein